MALERQVKVIKRVERERLEQEAAEKVGPHQTPRQAARSLVATVTEWIKESRQQRRDSLAALPARQYSPGQVADDSVSFSSTGCQN